jgi:DNA helicase-2/ATP-dependent DNA helicase PcrA
LKLIGASGSACGPGVWDCVPYGVGGLGYLARVTPDEVLDALDPEQRIVAAALDGPVCVLAGAGTGKTRAITHRIAYACQSGRQQPPHILAVTFTTRAAGEMRGRLRALGVDGVQARTFHSAALRQLQYFWPTTIGGAFPRIVETKAPLVAEASARCRINTDRAVVRDLAAEIEWAKVTQAVADDYPAAAAKAARPSPAGLDPAAVGRIYAAYEEVKTGRGLIDFEDVLLLTVGILADSPDIADQVRDRYRHFVVDEFQDVSPLQHRLLTLWLGDRRSLCVVGDPSQTIYSFAGATPEYLLGFVGRYPETTLVRLIRDYRSTPQVVGLANDLLRYGGDAGRQRVELVAQRDPGPRPELVEYPDEPAEAAGVADRIAALITAGSPPSQIAVLFRTNAQSQNYEQALSEARIPYVVRGGERFFERREVREALLLLRGAARADEPLGDLSSQVRGVVATLGWRPEPPAAGGATRDRWESIAAIVQLAEDFTASAPEASLAAFSAELERRAAAQHAPLADGVTLASLHAAKGLEWDAVFVVGLAEGLVPISYAETPEAVDEERRLLYVGITRAREHVRLSWAAARSRGARAGRRPSRFLSGLRIQGAPQLGGQAGRPATGRRASHRSSPTCRVCSKPLHEAAERKIGRCASCPATYDEALYERLRAWRLDQASAAKLPAYCIFTDATLVAIAETRPASEQALASIPGVGATKLGRYGAAVLEMCSGDG